MKPVTIFVYFVLVLNVAQAQNSYEKMGQKALMDGNFKLAVLHLEKAAFVDSANVNTLYMLGYSYYHSGEYKKSAGVFSHLIGLKPAETSAYYYRGKAYNIMATEAKSMPNTEQEKLLLAAIRDFTKAIELNSGDVKLYQNRAIAYRDYGVLKGQKIPQFYDKNRATSALKSCIADFQKVLEIIPGRKDIITQLEDAKQYLKGLKK